MLTKSSLKTEYSRLHPAIAEEEPEEEASPTSTSSTDMTAAFQEFMTTEKRAAPTPSSDLWIKRVELFTKTEERPPCLELLHSALSTVPPSSVEAERIFSICGKFYTSIRSSLFAETIDMLVSTKYFLLRHKDNTFLDI